MLVPKPCSTALFTACSAAVALPVPEHLSLLVPKPCSTALLTACSAAVALPAPEHLSMLVPEPCSTAFLTACSADLLTTFPGGRLAFGCGSPYITGPMIQGANSSSPTPESSLFDCLPEATATISSKICRPTTGRGVPSRMTPQLMSMSSCM
jgi:hypothetical protein